MPGRPRSPGHRLPDRPGLALTPGRRFPADGLAHGTCRLKPARLPERNIRPDPSASTEERRDGVPCQHPRSAGRFAPASDHGTCVLVSCPREDPVGGRSGLIDPIQNRVKRGRGCASRREGIAVDYVGHFCREVAAFEAAGRAAIGSEAAPAIRSCPGWVVTDLVLHLGVVHRSVARVIGERMQQPPGGRDRSWLGLAEEWKGWLPPGRAPQRSPVWWARPAVITTFKSQAPRLT